MVANAFLQVNILTKQLNYVFLFWEKLISRLVNEGNETKGNKN